MSNVNVAIESQYTTFYSMIIVKFDLFVTVNIFMVASHGSSKVLLRNGSST